MEIETEDETKDLKDNQRLSIEAPKDEPKVRSKIMIFNKEEK